MNLIASCSHDDTNSPLVGHSNEESLPVVGIECGNVHHPSPATKTVICFTFKHIAILGIPYIFSKFVNIPFLLCNVLLSIYYAFFGLLTIAYLIAPMFA